MLTNDKEMIIGVPYQDSFGFCHNGCMTADELLKECDCDNITKFIKINTVNNDITDITEKVACAFIDRYYSDIFSDYWEGRRSNIPVFVEESTVWDETFTNIMRSIEAKKKKYKC